MRRPAQATTLIELLIVLFIILIIAITTLPGLSSARATAKAATCQASLKDVGMVLTQYATAHNDRSSPVIGDLDTYWDRGWRVGWDVTAGRWQGVTPNTSSIWSCASSGAARVGNARALGLDNRYRDGGGRVYYVSRSRWQSPVNLVVAYDAQVNMTQEPFFWTRAVEPQGGDCSNEMWGWRANSWDRVPAYLPRFGPHASESYGILFGDGHAEVDIVDTGHPAVEWSGPQWWSFGE